MNENDLTIICPTYNRPYMLDRALKYYADSQFSCKIIIADSSESGAQNILMGILEKYSSLLNLEYFHIPDNPDFALKLYKASTKVSSKYSIILPDDDLVIKSGLLNVMSLLEKDSSVAAAYGNRLSIAAISEPNNKLSWIDSFPFYSVSIPISSKRSSTSLLKSSKVSSSSSSISNSNVPFIKSNISSNSIKLVK